jgi:hypothetical protein
MAEQLKNQKSKKKKIIPQILTLWSINSQLF